MTDPNLKPRWAVPGTLTRDNTRSTAAIYARLRWLMLQYVTPAGERLVDYLGGDRIWVRAQPEPPVFPYLTLLLDRTTTPGFNSYRETATLEVQAIGRPEAQLPLVESAMDIVDQCLLSLTDPYTGLMVGRSRRRYTLPQFTDPADTTVVGVVGQYELYLWPQVLTERAS
jgi:hypothetical protein